MIEFKETTKEKTKRIARNVRLFLESQGIKNIKIMDSSTYHWRIGSYDFWPTTGTYVELFSGKKGQGVMSLVRLINEKRV